VRLEMRLAEQRRPIAGLVAQVRGDARRVDGQRHAVGVYAVRADVLSREHGRASRHADGVLVVGTLVPDAVTRPAVGDGRAGPSSTVAAERVVALLIGGDEEDLPAHASYG